MAAPSFAETETLRTTVELLKSKRPGYNEEKPYDLDYDEDMGYFLTNSLVGHDKAIIGELPFLMKMTEIGTMLKAPGDTLDKLIKYVQDASYIAGSESKTDAAESNDLTEEANKEVVDSTRTLLHAYLLNDGWTETMTVRMLDMLEQGEIKTLKDLNRMYSDFTAVLAYMMKSNTTLNLGSHSTVDMVRVKKYETKPGAKLKEMLVSETADTTYVPGHRLVGNLVAVDRVHMKDQKYYMKGREIETDDMGLVVDPAVGQYLTVDLAVELGKHMKYSHTTRMDLYVACALLGLVSYKHNGPRHEFDVHAREDVKADALKYLGPSKGMKMECYWEALAKPLKDVMLYITTRNKHPHVWCAKGVSQFDQFVEQVKDVLAAHADIRAAIEGALAIPFKVVDSVVDAYQGASDAVVDCLTHDGIPLCQSTHLSLYGVVPEARGAVLNKQMLFVKDHFPPTQIGDAMCEVTIDSYIGLDKSGRIKKAVELSPWKVGTGKVSTVTPVTTMHPGSCNQGLDTSRRHARASEGDKYSDDVDNAKQLTSGWVDTQVDFAYQSFIGVDNDFAILFEEMQRHGGSDWEAFADNVRAGAPETTRSGAIIHHPGVLVYDVNPSFICRNQLGKGFPYVIPGELDANVHAYCKSMNAKDFANPVTSRFTVEPKDVPLDYGKHKTVICAHNFEINQGAATGYDKKAPQFQVLNQLATVGNFDRIMMKMKMTNEHNFRMTEKGRPVLSSIMELLTNTFGLVTFIPTSRVHNGWFWMVASQRFKDKSQMEINKKRLIIHNWECFVINYAWAMYASNVLKDTFSLWSIMGHRVVPVRLYKVLFAMRGCTVPAAYVPVGRALSLIGFTGLKTTIASRAISEVAKTADAEDLFASAFPDYSEDPRLVEAIDEAAAHGPLLPSESPALTPFDSEGANDLPPRSRALFTPPIQNPE